MNRLVLFLIALTAGLLYWVFNDPFNTHYSPLEAAVCYRATEITEHPIPETLTVATYNTKFAGGRIDFWFNCLGDRVLMDSAEVLANLDRLCAVINGIAPDVICLQELDQNSHRTASIDMIQYILDKTDLNYADYGSHWKADYIPNKGMRHMNSGSAILSRFPLQSGIRVSLPMFKKQNPITRYFYLKRNILATLMIVGDDSLPIVTTHLSAYDKDGARAQQIDSLTGVVATLQKQYGKVLLAGDLNLLSPYASRLEGFEDCRCEGTYDANDYRGTEHLLQPFYRDYVAAISPAELRNNEAAHHTHSVDKALRWNRKLDYIFANEGVLVEGSGATHQGVVNGVATMQASDHAPVSVRIALPANLKARN